MPQTSVIALIASIAIEIETIPAQSLVQKQKFNPPMFVVNAMKVVRSVMGLNNRIALNAKTDLNFSLKIRLLGNVSMNVLIIIMQIRIINANNVINIALLAIVANSILAFHVKKFFWI